MLKKAVSLLEIRVKFLIYDNVYLRNYTINKLPLSEHQPAEHGGAMFPVDEP